mgnify:CR=1 FL=1
MSLNEQTQGTPGDGRIIEKTLPIVGVRKTIATRMEESLKRSPQVSGFSKTDMSALVEFKQKLASQGHNISYTEMFVKIAAVALEQHPMLNSSRQDNKIIIYKSKNIGVAIAADNGILMVPVVKNAESKSLIEISNEVKELIKKVKTGKITQDDMVGGTFTVSSVGMFDVDGATPILNAPEAALLAIGVIRKEPVVEDDDSIKIRPVAFLSMTLDHAVIDGVPGAKFLMTVKEIVGNPEQYLKV